MQIKGLHKNIYTLYAYARKQECLEAYRKKYADIVTSWELLKAAGTQADAIPRIVGYSRATYYRAKKVLNDLAKGILPPSKRPKNVNTSRWGQSEKQLVLRIRRENPSYGKAKIARIVKRDFDKLLSESTVGRILTHLKEKKLLTHSPSAVRTRRKRNFTNGHAKAWHYKEYSQMRLGERLQIDHMTVTKNGVGIKHFQAWERQSKFVHAQVYSHAKSRSARRFLEELLEKAPFKILSIQVDGGSEFMGEFEQACAELNLELIVLPPARPTYNGGVERTNRTFREEFYNTSSLMADSIGAFRNELRDAVKKYNEYRPHFSLEGLTPMEYIHNLNLEAAA